MFVNFTSVINRHNCLISVIIFYLIGMICLYFKLSKLISDFLKLQMKFRETYCEFKLHYLRYLHFSYKYLRREQRSIQIFVVLRVFY